MSTQRLTQELRDDIQNKMHNTINRILTVDTFPIEYDNRKHFLLDLYPTDFLEAVEVFKKYKQWLGKSKHLPVNITPNDTEELEKYAIHLTLPNSIPEFDRRPVVPEDSLYYTRILAWCRERVTLEEEARFARQEINDILYACTSIGQLNRVIPDLMSFVPDYARSTLKLAQRRSRIPRALLSKPKVDIDKALNTLTRGALLPEKEYSEVKKLPSCEKLRV